MQIIIKLGQAQAKIIDNEGYTVLDYSVDNYNVEVSVERLIDVAVELQTALLAHLEKGRNHD